MRSPRSNVVLLFAGLVVHLIRPVTAERVYTLSAAEFGNVVANLNAPEIASVTGKRPDSFFALTTQVWPTMPPGRWYLVGGTTELVSRRGYDRGYDSIVIGDARCRVIDKSIRVRWFAKGSETKYRGAMAFGPNDRHAVMPWSVARTLPLGTWGVVHGASHTLVHGVQNAAREFSVECVPQTRYA